MLSHTDYFAHLRSTRVRLFIVGQFEEPYHPCLRRRAASVCTESNECPTAANKNRPTKSSMNRYCIHAGSFVDMNAPRCTRLFRSSTNFLSTLVSTAKPTSVHISCSTCLNG